jgi:hypothetical protein
MIDCTVVRSLSRKERKTMNSYLETWKKNLPEVIAKCEMVDALFDKHNIPGTGRQPEGDEMVAGFCSTYRNGFTLNWYLEHAPRLEISIFDAGGTGCCPVAVVFINGVWSVSSDREVSSEDDGRTDLTRSLAADCHISPGEERDIDETEAMQIVVKLITFFMSQPAG